MSFHGATVSQESVKRPGGSGVLQPVEAKPFRTGNIILPKKAAGKKKTTKSHTAAIAHIFDSDRDSKGDRPYYEDGDPQLYTPRNIEKRELLRTNPALRDAIRRFAACFKFRDETDHMDKESYVDLHVRILALLIPKLSPAEQLQVALEDWDNDAKGERFLSYAAFHNSMFELADLWCPGIDAAQYLYFINTLLGKLTTASYDVAAYDVLSPTDASTPVGMLKESKQF